VLDKGTDDGIARDGPVVTPQGVVGKVYQVGSSWSRVLLVSDTSSAVDALIQRTRAPVVVEGRLGGDCRLLYLARADEAAVGDVVVTSGLGGIYPKAPRGPDQQGRGAARRGLPDRRAQDERGPGPRRRGVRGASDSGGEHVRALLAWFLLLGLGLLGQTTLLSAVLPDPWRPDVTRSLVLWAALTGVPKGGPLLAVAAGLALDALSGCSLAFGAGLRLVALYGLARPFRGVFFDDHPILLVPLGAAGAFGDAIGAWAMSSFSFPEPFSASVVLSAAWRQALAEALCVPVVFLLMEITAGRRPREAARRPL
jgi:hypothetical protein